MNIDEGELLQRNFESLIAELDAMMASCKESCIYWKKETISRVQMMKLFKEEDSVCAGCPGKNKQECVL